MIGEGNIKKLEPYFGFIIITLGIIFYFPFLGSVHLFDWDEINFAESSREMLVTQNYFRVTVEYQPFWEKPPLFFWLQAMSMKLFGVNEFAARFPNAVFGIITLSTLYFTGKRIMNALFGFLWAFLFLISFLPFFYFKSGIIDPVFNYFIFISLLLLIRSVKVVDPQKAILFAFAAGLLNGLAVLTKGPVGLLLVIITIFIIWVFNRFKKVISIKAFIIFLGGVFISSSLWYLPELINNGPWFLQEFLKYQIELFTQPVAGHQQPFYYHFLVVFIGCFPLSILALPAMFKKSSLNNLSDHKRWMIVLFAVVMILFSIVKTKIAHYSSMAYLPLSYMATMALYISIKDQVVTKKWVLILLGIMGVIFSLIMFAIPYFFINKDFFIEYIKDPFAKAALAQNFHWTGLECIFGALFLIGIIILIVFLNRKKAFAGIFLYGIISLTILTGYLKVVIPKVEKYVQGDLIDFYKSIKDQDVYVVPVGFKTYAYLFYFEQPYRPDQPTGIPRRDWLTKGLIDKTTYIVVKNTEMYVKALPDVSLVKTAGGYVIYKREPIP